MSNNKPPASLMPAMYSHRINDIVTCARGAGYCIAVHGSMQNDLDLVAIPWVKHAISPKGLARRLCRELDCTLQDRHQKHGPTAKPHGRVVFTLMMGGCCYMDLSVMPRTRGGK